MSLLCEEQLFYSDTDAVEESLVEEIDYVLFQRIKVATRYYRKVLAAYKKYIGANIAQFMEAHNNFINEINYKMPADELELLYINLDDFDDFDISMPITEWSIYKKVHNYSCFYRTILKGYLLHTDADVTPFIDAHNNFLTTLQPYLSDRKLEKLVLTKKRINDPDIIKR